jgi:hypothetical protein
MDPKPVDPKPIEYGYIHNLDLDSLQKEESTKITLGSTAIVLNTVLMFDPNCNPEQVQDIKEVVCLAELAAQKKFPGRDQGIEYFNEIKLVLSNVGFTNIGFEWRDINTSSKTFTVDTQIVEVFKELLPAEPLGFALKTFAALKKSQDKSETTAILQAFIQESHSKTDARFGFGMVVPDGDHAKITLIAFKLHATDVTETFLWRTWPSKSSLSLKYAKVEFLFDSELYARSYRDMIRAKLEKKVKEDEEKKNPVVS